MRRQDFQYALPEALIARHPLPERSASRLLRLQNHQPCVHGQFRDLPELLNPGDVLVINDTEVIKARLKATKDSGGTMEILVERVVGTHEALCQTRSSKPLRPGRTAMLVDGSCVQMLEREEDFFRLQFADPVAEVLERCGEIPLPPYMERTPDDADAERYQTVFAASPGAVAAPTAGLHFDGTLLHRIAARGVEVVRITLHVGAGTFQPVRVDDIATHRMHPEWFSVGPDAAERINVARAAGKRVVAVGTTVVRTLESATTEEGRLQAGQGDTRLFITPGYRFRCVDALITNFHLPETTLLMLVCAFGGRDRVLAAYREAVVCQYRFFSYGDAMFLERGLETPGV
jgi:S-adenosylmethionine:tRNA ribosyltransferase-isomerase